jgi:uncharacterized RDD family membrane protein YckC
MEIYRARRRRYLPNESQPPLPFQGESHVNSDLHDQTLDTAELSALGAAQPLPRPARKLIPPRGPDRVEISILQPELDFSAASDDRTHPQTALVPVAPLRERREAGLLDAAFLAFSYVGFGALFHSLGGRLSFTKVDGVVFAATFFLLYTIYFSIFTFFGGATPGMLLRGLYVVRLDGRLADTRQLLWRSFGYLLSGGALMMGFLWALWDEDHFTWHDRMSHTYVTEALPLDISDSIEVGESQQTFAQK